MVKEFFIFRHGETDWNREQRLQGSTDIPLNDVGRRQATELHRFFLREPVDIFLSSDLSRALETAKIAAGNQEFRVIADSRFRETNLGKAEGLTVTEVIETFGEEVWRAWHSSISNSDCIRFPEGETKKQHLDRLFSALNEYALHYDYSKMAVATHGGALRRMIHHLRPDLKEPVKVPNCAIYKFEVEVESRIWKVDIVNLAARSSDGVQDE